DLDENDFTYYFDNSDLVLTYNSGGTNVSTVTIKGYAGDCGGVGNHIESIVAVDEQYDLYGQWTQATTARGDIESYGLAGMTTSVPTAFDTFYDWLVDGFDDMQGHFVLPAGGDFATNVIEGTGSGETINGTSNADSIAGLAGNDTIYGDDGDDFIFGGDG